VCVSECVVRVSECVVCVSECVVRVSGCVVCVSECVVRVNECVVCVYTQNSNEVKMLGYVCLSCDTM